MVLVHVIIVIQHNYAIIEEVVVVIERVVQQVDIVTISNNGMDLMVVPVETCGVVVIINQVVLVAMIVFNNKLLVVMVIVNQTTIGGTVHHENKNNRKLTDQHPSWCKISFINNHTLHTWCLFFLTKKTVFLFRSLFDCSMLCSFHFTYIHLNGPALIYSFFFFADSDGPSVFYRFQT